MPAPEVAIGSLALPFRHPFGHASATRREAQNVLVRLSADGLEGFGEGCPRDYVSGETPEGALAWLRARAPQVAREVEDLGALRRWLADNAAEIDANPSAVCALETALLDLFARREGISVEALITSPALDRPLQASAVYGASGGLTFALRRARFALAGMGEAKLKLSGDAASDLKRLRALTGRGRVRLDANNLWPDAEAAIAALTPLAAHAWAVEEPVRPRAWSGLAEIGRRTGLAIILDESFGGPADLAPLAPDVRWLPNLRVSHLGGLLRSLQALAAARAAGLEVIVGAHVGETSLLARAGVALAAAAGTALVGYEGAYGLYLLREDGFAPDVTFDGRGRVIAGKTFDPAAPGWGLAPRANLTAALA